MERQERLLYDTGRLPIWLRMPCAAVGAFLLWLSASMLSFHLFGYDLGLRFTIESGSPVLGFFGMLALGLFLSSVWFLRNQIYVDATGREILVRHSGLLGCSVRRIPLSDATGISVRWGRIRGEFWDISIEFKNGGEEWLSRVYRDEDKEAAVQAFSEGAQLPILNRSARAGV